MADAVEEAVHDALPESDIVVHVEPQGDESALSERALAAAQLVPQVREIHNLSVLRTDGGAELSLHLKLPGDLRLDAAHAVATEVERTITDSVPEVVSVQTHLEPLAEPARGTDVEPEAGYVESIVRAATGAAPRKLRFLDTDEGLIAFLTLALDPGTPLADAHRRASEIEERIRTERPEIADVIVHTEP
jgi:divalent metal cation (Fe/Co/Zn/Cd) transporter